MTSYPVLEEHGFCVSISAEREPTKRWRSWVRFERDRDFARLKGHASEPRRVPNDYPDEARAVQAAYDYARQLIAQEMARS